ncbi:MAG: alpha/beta hydrolase [Alphaproteobacteria bacterium]|nr:alpha/beta hydrolase [Alphaproteobacteria bacterium]
MSDFDTPPPSVTSGLVLPEGTISAAEPPSQTHAVDATAPAAPSIRPLREPPVLTLPDCKGAPASHWLTLWEQQHGLRRVAQHDWQRPLRGDWMMQLQETMLRHEQVHLLAHGLAAHLVDAWLRHTQQAKRVKSVLLVDPIDLQSPELRETLFTWKPLAAQTWPLPLAVLWKERQPTPDLTACLNAWGATVLSDAPAGGGVVGGWARVHEYWSQVESIPQATVAEVTW